MFTERWIYDAIIYIYALSLLFYFSDVVGRNQSAKRMGTGLLIFVWALQTAFFVERMVEQQYMPVFTLFDIIFLFSWLLVTLSLAIHRFFRVEILVFFINVFGFAALALNVFSDSAGFSSLVYWGISDELLFIHITLAVGSYVAFTISAILSGMYLFLHRKLKKKLWTASVKRLPSLEKIDSCTYWAVVIAAPLLILSLSLGVVWIILHENNLRLLLDPKVISSLFVLAVYAFYLMQKLSFKKPGSKLAFWNIIAFVIVMIHFFISNDLSDFHRWNEDVSVS